MSNRYETVCIVKPDVGDEAIKSIIQKATATLETGGGTLGRLDEWGRRKLAYPIQKKNDGYYFVLEYNSTPDVSKEICRQIKLNENVLRQQTVRLGEKAPEQAAEQIAAETATAPVTEGGQS